MKLSTIMRIEAMLSSCSIEIEQSMDDNDVEYFQLPFVGPEKFTTDTLAEFTLGGTLSEDWYLVELLRFPMLDVTALIFNSAMASGEYELMGLTKGLNPSHEFITSSLKRWTQVTDFKWPTNVKIFNEALLPAFAIKNI